MCSYNVQGDVNPSVFSFTLGSGIFTDNKGGMYEGDFHDNQRHGEGIQIYRFVSVYCTYTCIYKLHRIL